MNGSAGSESSAVRNHFANFADDSGNYSALSVYGAGADADADADANDDHLPKLPTAKLMGRRTKATTLTPLDTSVQVTNGTDFGGGLHAAAADVTDGPRARRSSAIKSINIGFADLSYTVKVWRYGKWRRGEFGSKIIFYQVVVEVFAMLVSDFLVFNYQRFFREYF